MAFMRSLRLVLLLGLAGLIGAVVFSLLSSARGSLLSRARTEPEANEEGDPVAQRARDVEILRTRRGSPTLQLDASESLTHRSGELELASVTFRLFDDGQQTVIEAPSARSLPPVDTSVAPASSPAEARSLPRPLEGLGSWALAGGVTIRARGGLLMVTPSLVYAEAEGQARTNERVSFARGPATGNATGMIYDVGGRRLRFPGELTAAMEIGGLGQVALHAAGGAYHLEENTFEMDNYRATTQRGEVLSGSRLVARFREEGAISRLEGDRGFVLETTHTAAPSSEGSPLARLLALGGARRMQGRQIAIVFGEEDDPRTIEVSGDAILTADNAGGDGRPASIAAETLVFDLLQGNLSRARAIGAVDLKGAPPEGGTGGFHLMSDHLDAAFDPNLGSILQVEGEGEIALTDQGLESHGSRTSLNPDTDIVTLSGDEASPASATWMGRKIQAQGIEADRRRKTLSARGGVRVSYAPEAAEGGGASDQAVPFFRSGETVYVMSGSLTFSNQGQAATYRDHVRLWQGDNRIEASEIEVNESSGTLQARGDVISTFHQPPPEGRPAADPAAEIVTVAAALMTYDRGARSITYSGNVLVTQAGLRVTADRLTVDLQPGGAGAERITARGAVTLRDGERLGKGDLMVAEMQENTIRLSGAGREATVQDLSGQQVVRGSSLTMDRYGDKILVESELGGRTWITLKPRQKGAPGVGSKPHD